ncbi:hypothetical protein D3C72_755530 [compost metagenome]
MGVIGLYCRIKQGTAANEGRRLGHMLIDTEMGHQLVVRRIPLLNSFPDFAPDDLTGIVESLNGNLILTRKMAVQSTLLNPGSEGDI